MNRPKRAYDFLNSASYEVTRARRCSHDWALCGASCRGRVPVLEGGSEAHASPAARGPEALARAVTPGRLRAHLVALEAIARRNGGSRAAGGPGYQQSVAYVAGQLRAAGYRPRLQSFSFDLFRETRPPRLERLAPEPAQYTRPARLPHVALLGQRNGHRPGCTGRARLRHEWLRAFGFRGLPAGRRCALEARHVLLTQKAQNARSAGASAVLIANEGAPGRTAPIAATLVRPGIGIPALMISSTLGSELAQSAQAGTVRVRIVVSAVSRTARAANVIADLPGRRSGAVLLGRASRRGRERARDQRQRIRLGTGAGGRAAGPPPWRSAGARASLRVLGRRGARARRLRRPTCRV